MISPIALTVSVFSASGCVFILNLLSKTTDTSSDSTAQADGFTFTIVNGSNNSKTSTGGAPAGISRWAN